MARPVKLRRICCVPAASYFKPVGIPMRELEEIVLGLDELEAMRLTDLDGLYQADAAEQMGVSRQTIGNILNSAHHKLADALLNGKALRIGPHEENKERADCMPCATASPLIPPDISCSESTSDLPKLTE